MNRVGDLEINQDLALQEHEWKAERVGWALLIVVVVAAAVGLFGNGPLSWTTASTSDDALVVDFERFGRRGGSEELSLRSDASAAHDGSWEIEISHDYLSAVRVDAVQPEPETVETVAGGVRYTFAQATPGASLEATFSLTPRALWMNGGHVKLSGGEEVRVRHFFFP